MGCIYKLAVRLNMKTFTRFVQIYTIGFCLTYFLWDKIYLNIFLQWLNCASLLILALVYYFSNKETITIGWVDIKSKYSTLVILICLSIYFLPIFKIKAFQNIEKIVILYTIMVLFIRLFYNPFYKSHLSNER